MDRKDRDAVLDASLHASQDDLAFYPHEADPLVGIEVGPDGRIAALKRFQELARLRPGQGPIRLVVKCSDCSLAALGVQGNDEGELVEVAVEFSSSASTTAPSMR